MFRWEVSTGTVLETRIYVTLLMAEYVMTFLNVCCVFGKNKYYIFVWHSVLYMAIRPDLWIIIKYSSFLVNFCLFNLSVAERYVKIFQMVRKNYSCNLSIFVSHWIQMEARMHTNLKPVLPLCVLLLSLWRS